MRRLIQGKSSQIKPDSAQGRPSSLNRRVAAERLCHLWNLVPSVVLPRRLVLGPRLSADATDGLRPCNTRLFEIFLPVIFLPFNRRYRSPTVRPRLGGIRPDPTKSKQIRVNRAPFPTMEGRNYEAGSWPRGDLQDVLPAIFYLENGNRGNHRSG
jgi:hypothetical protein